MTPTQFERERRYRVAMAIAKSMLRQGVIDNEDYETIKQIMIEKYNPFYGGLSPEMS